MPRPPTAPEYVALVQSLAAEGWKPPRIHAIVEQEAKATGRTDWPSERTIRRIYERWKRSPEHERREDERYAWPRSHQLGLVPWEASLSALELVRYREDRGERAPTNREARWFWRLRQAAPTMPLDLAETLAETLSIDEAVARGAPFEPADRWTVLALALAYQPWRTAADWECYRAAIDRHELWPATRTFRIWLLCSGGYAPRSNLAPTDEGLGGGL